MEPSGFERRRANYRTDPATTPALDSGAGPASGINPHGLGAIASYLRGGRSDPAELAGTAVAEMHHCNNGSLLSARARNRPTAEGTKEQKYAAHPRKHYIRRVAVSWQVAMFLRGVNRWDSGGRRSLGIFDQKRS
jgi:hypothetical protein